MRLAMSHQITRPVNLSGREIAMQTRRIEAGSAYTEGALGRVLINESWVTGGAPMSA